MDCDNIIDVSTSPNGSVSTAVLLSEEISLQSVPLKIDEEKSDEARTPEHDNLLPENTVLVQTENGLLLSMPDSLGGITYHPFQPGDITDGRSISFLVNCSSDGVVPAPPQDFDTRALDKFPDITTGLQLPDPSTAVISTPSLTTHEMMSPGKVASELRFTTDEMSLLPGHVGAGSTDTAPQEPKKKGGWPKGKKRKDGIGKPKTPYTAFLVYANRRRSEIKQSNPELIFPEVNKILGSEWSLMAQDEKQKYFDEAAIDKKRYIAELKVLQESHEYKDYLKKRKLKTISGITNKLDKDSPECLIDLHCAVCDQYFSSQHNKTEHMYGSKHFQAVADEINKEAKEMQQRAAPHLTNGVCDDHSPGGRNKTDDTLDMDSFTMIFYEKNLERELEIQELRRSIKASLDQYNSNIKKVEQSKEEMIKLEQAIANMKSCALSLASQIHSLKMVPTLFGVLNL